MDPVTVICVLRSGGPYGPEYVQRLERMVRRHLPGLDRFVCLTDVPGNLGCEKSIMIHAWPGHWSKVELFDPALPLAGRILYLDLDVIVQGDLRPIVDTPGDFVIVASGSQKPHPRRVPGYNSSVMVWDHGCRERIWSRFRADDCMRRFVGDQDWIGRLCPGEATFAPGLVEKYRPGIYPAAPVVLCTNPKPHEIPDDPFVRRHWLAA